MLRVDFLFFFVFKAGSVEVGANIALAPWKEYFPPSGDEGEPQRRKKSSLYALAIRFFEVQVFGKHGAAFLEKNK